MNDKGIVKEKPCGQKHLFPAFESTEHQGAASLVYLDSAATSLMPRVVIDTIAEYEAKDRSNIHRGIHRMAEASTELYESARQQLAAHLRCAARNIILTHGTTESINTVAQAWAFHNLSVGDTIVLATDNHHANIVPWQILAQEKALNLVFVEVLPQGMIDPDSWAQALAQSPRFVALTHVSNVTGVEHPVAEMVAEAHAVGAKVLVDCAQSFGHKPLDMQKLGADMAAGSCHKAYGPFGFGFLFCSDTALAHMYPRYGGGGMIANVTREGFSPAEGSAAFEAGTPVVSAAAGLKTSLDFIDEIGLEAIASHATNLSEQTKKGLRCIKGVRLVADQESCRGEGSSVEASRGRSDAAKNHCSIVSFTCERYHPHDIAAHLDERSIAVRAGHHCAMPLHDALGISASIRVSFGVYNDAHDVDMFLNTLCDIIGKERHGVTYRHRR